MSEREDRASMEERRVAELVRQLPAPRPEADYRARLKREFVAGSLTSPSEVRILSGERDQEHSHPRGLWDSLLIPAAAGLLVVAGLLLNRGSGWQVYAVTGAGSVEVDGHAVPLDGAALSERGKQLVRAIADGGRIQVPPGASVTLTAPGRLAIEITPGTEAELSAPPARWLGRIASAEVQSGEIRVTTGDRFHGSRLDVKTPEAAVEVTGTTLAVICEPTGTCVCVMEGVVHVGARGQSMVAVPAGRRRYIFRDGRPAEQAEMRPHERVMLGGMRLENPASDVAKPTPAVSR